MLSEGEPFESSHLTVPTESVHPQGALVANSLQRTSGNKLQMLLLWLQCALTQCVVEVESVVGLVVGLC
jgi:hypothetical protein